MSHKKHVLLQPSYKLLIFRCHSCLTGGCKEEKHRLFWWCTFFGRSPRVVLHGHCKYHHPESKVVCQEGILRHHKSKKVKLVFKYYTWRFLLRVFLRSFLFSAISVVSSVLFKVQASSVFKGCWKYKSTTFLDLREFHFFCRSFAAFCRSLGGNFQRFCWLNLNRGHAFTQKSNLAVLAVWGVLIKKASDLEKQQSTPKTPKTFMDLKSPGTYIFWGITRTSLTNSIVHDCDNNN